MKTLSVYIHIPFCAKKCDYCDFLSFEQTNQDAYFDALLDEIRQKSPRYRNFIIVTVFFGGGTPTFAAQKNILNVLRVLRENYQFDNNVEISLEANPDSAYFEKLRAYFAAGFNRISIGVQSFDDVILRSIGRIHTAEQAEQAVKTAYKAGFVNVGVDLMFALPGQSVEQAAQSAEKAVSLGVKHVSAYSLTLEAGTPLFACFSPIDDETDRKMYAVIKKVLENARFSHYEISNFALPGFECKHNMVYWQNDNYVGFGLGAHSHIDNRRFANVSGLNDYIAHPLEEITLEILTKRARQSEFFILGLRLINGVKEGDFEQEFGETAENVFGGVLDKHRANGLLSRDAGVVKLTEKGLDLANIVMADFLLDFSE